MQYNIYCNEKKLNRNHFLAIAEYIKRLSPYCSVAIFPGTAQNIEKSMIRKGHYCIILTDGLSTHSSVDFSKTIEDLQLNGFSTVHFFIGYSQDEIKKLLVFENPDTLAMKKISICTPSLSHETATVLFLEQLYRSYTIIHGKTYHK